jgi:hypothetical protein
MKRTLPLDQFMNRAVNDSRLLPTHICLFMAMLYLGSGHSEGSAFRITRKILMRFSHILSFATYHKNMRQLVDYGYINYWPSYNPYQGSRVAFVLQKKKIIAKEIHRHPAANAAVL